MTAYSRHDLTATQREKADPRQVQNNAGGYVYQITDEQRLARFLVLGTEGGTFYASERELTRENGKFLVEYAQRNPGEFYDTLFSYNDENRVPRHSTILYALAILFAHGGPEAREAIKKDFRKFVRIGTHLFEFVKYAELFRGWGRALRTVVGDWYTRTTPDDLAYQIIKYRQRHGWTHRDLLRKAHPKRGFASTHHVVDYAVHGVTEDNAAWVPPILGEFEALKHGMPASASTLLPWEGLPTEALKDPAIWRKLLAEGRLPLTAMIRNLGRMTALGVFDGGSPGAYAARETVVQTLRSETKLAKARIHPFNVLVALKTYQSGAGFRGSLSWSPVRQIVDALDEAYYLSFGNVEVSGKRLLLALDVSGSMGALLANTNVSAREGAAAMVMATLKADPDSEVVGFTSPDRSHVSSYYANYYRKVPQVYAGLSRLDISPRQRLDDVLKATDRLPFGGTDAYLPIAYALDNRERFDAFVVYTDNETWAGKIHTMEALKRYRAQVNPEAKLVVVGMTSTGFSIADPEDPGALDVVGFDSATPNLIADFTAGRL